MICPYCLLKSGEYFTRRQIGRMKPFCTNPSGLCKEVEE